MLDFEELPCEEKPQALMLWLHGLGADGFDLQPAAEMLDVPAIRHVFPHAPVRPVTINAGMTMRAWYDIAAADLSWQEDEAGMRASAQMVKELADDLCRNSGLPLILAGFSQGAVVSLTAACMGIPGLIGVVAMSGYVPQWLLPSLTSLRGVPVLMAHGEQDGVIPLALALAGRKALADNEIEVAWHSYEMPHAICQQELRDIADWLGACRVLDSRISPAGKWRP